MVLKKNSFLLYLLKFLATFCLLYYGTLALIGITAQGGYYSPFAARYLNYVAALRALLLNCTRQLLHVFGFNTYLKDIYTIKLQNGLGVHVGYDCIGYGVMIFWVSFIFANNGSCISKAKWITGGLAAIWFVNVGRIALLLVAVDKKWPSPFNLDNHTLFNIVAYTVIFSMIYLFDRLQQQQQLAG